MSASTADFNADHKLDVAIATPGGVDVLLGNGNGTFQRPVFINYNNDDDGAVPAPFLAAADFNGDGKLDLVSADQYDESAPWSWAMAMALFRGRNTSPSVAPPTVLQSATSMATKPRIWPSAWTGSAPAAE
jgi:hypothetical protein